jgi:hypothetical protein
LTYSAAVSEAFEGALVTFTWNAPTLLGDKLGSFNYDLALIPAAEGFVSYSEAKTIAIQLKLGIAYTLTVTPRNSIYFQAADHLANQVSIALTLPALAPLYDETLVADGGPGPAADTTSV